MNLNTTIKRIGLSVVAVVAMTMANNAFAQNLQSVSNYSKTHEKFLAHQNKVQEQIRLKEAQEFVNITSRPWLLMPGFLIFVAVLAFNLIGDTIRDVLDPKSKVR